MIRDFPVSIFTCTADRPVSRFLRTRHKKAENSMGSEVVKVLISVLSLWIMRNRICVFY